MKALPFAAVLFFVSIAAYSQKNLLVWKDSRQLEWNDFAGEAKDSSQFAAESFAEVRYNYKFDSLQELNFEVFANFNRNISWTKKEYRSEALLKHEQLHFDIAELFARKLKEAFANFRFTKNYANEILQVFNEKKTQYHLTQNSYDEETNHSLNTEKQKEWEAHIHNELSLMDGNYQLVYFKINCRNIKDL